MPVGTFDTTIIPVDVSIHTRTLYVMEAMVYKNRQLAINLLTINITKWGTKNKVIENTSQRPEIPYVHSGFFSGDSKYHL